jgi:ribosome-binding protein aMBF1 (putative translation factor)
VAAADIQLSRLPRNLAKPDFAFCRRLCHKYPAVTGNKCDYGTKEFTRQQKMLPNHQNFAQRLTKRRTFIGISPSEVARQCGVDRSYISKLESGVAVNPSEEVLDSLAQILRTNVQWLVSGKGDE